MGSIAFSTFPTFVALFDTLAAMDDGSAAVLLDAIRGPGAFDEDAERVEELSTRLKADVETTSLVIGGLAYLYNEVRRQHSPEMDMTGVATELVESIGSADGEVQPRLVARLADLLAPNDSAERYLRQDRLRAGSGLNARGFSSSVDIRPDFLEGEAEIAGFVPLVQFSVATDSSDPMWKSVVLQLDARSLRRLRQAAEEAETKLDVVMRQSWFRPVALR